MLKFIWPALFAVYAAYCLMRGKIGIQSNYYYLDSNPVAFWSAIAIVMLGAALAGDRALS
jgi:hypothetical protein